MKWKYPVQLRKLESISQTPKVLTIPIKVCALANSTRVCTVRTVRTRKWAWTDTCACTQCHLDPLLQFPPQMVRLHLRPKLKIVTAQSVTSGLVPKRLTELIRCTIVIHGKFYSTCYLLTKNIKTTIHFRHVVKSAAPPSSCTSSSSPTSPVGEAGTSPSPTSQQPFLALPTNPIIIVPYSLFRSASVLPALSTAGGIPSPDTPCFLLPNGTLQPMTSALVAAQNEQVLKATNKGNKETPVRYVCHYLNLNNAKV